MPRRLIHNTILIYKIKPKLAMAQLQAALLYRAKLWLGVAVSFPFYSLGILLEWVGVKIQDVVVVCVPIINDENYNRIYKICHKAFKNHLTRKNRNNKK